MPCCGWRARVGAGEICLRDSAPIRLPSGAMPTVWKRFERLSKAGVFEAFFDALASMSPSAHLIQMFDSTIVRAHVSAAGAKWSGSLCSGGAQDPRHGKTARPSVVRVAGSRRKSTQKQIVAEI